MQDAASLPSEIPPASSTNMLHSHSVGQVRAPFLPDLSRRISLWVKELQGSFASLRKSAKIFPLRKLFHNKSFLEELPTWLLFALHRHLMPDNSQAFKEERFYWHKVPL